MNKGPTGVAYYVLKSMDMFAMRTILMQTKRFESFLVFISLTHVEHFLEQQIYYLSFEIPVDQIDELEKRIENELSFAFTAYNYFITLGFHKDVYDCLCYGIEIIELAEHAYGFKVYNDKASLYQTKSHIEIELDFQRRPIHMLELINKIRRNKANKNDNGGMVSLKFLNDSQINTLARTVTKSFQLPDERLNNVVNELKAYRMFHQRCSDDNIIVLQFRDYNEPKKDSYRLPIRFVLRSKKTGLETTPSSDMGMLLSSWGF